MVHECKYLHKRHRFQFCISRSLSRHFPLWSSHTVDFAFLCARALHNFSIAFFCVTFETLFFIHKFFVLIHSMDIKKARMLNLFIAMHTAWSPSLKIISIDSSELKFTSHKNLIKNSSSQSTKSHILFGYYRLQTIKEWYRMTTN